MKSGGANNYKDIKEFNEIKEIKESLLNLLKIFNFFNLFNLFNLFLLLSLSSLLFPLASFLSDREAKRTQFLAQRIVLSVRVGHQVGLFELEFTRLGVEILRVHLDAHHLGNKHIVRTQLHDLLDATFDIDR